MAGMKVTLSAAMRARDVSRPSPDDEAAAEQAEARRESRRQRPEERRRQGPARHQP